MYLFGVSPRIALALLVAATVQVALPLLVTAVVGEGVLLILVHVFAPLAGAWALSRPVGLLRRRSSVAFGVLIPLVALVLAFALYIAATPFDLNGREVNRADGLRHIALLPAAVAMGAIGGYLAAAHHQRALDAFPIHY